MNNPMKILLVDNHPLFRHGLREVILSEPDYQIVGEAGDGAAALPLIGQTKPDVVILDIDLPKLDGLELIRRLQLEAGSPQIIVLTLCKNESVFNEAITRGVKGFILKEDPANEILQCLKALVAGQPYISASISGLLLRRHEKGRALHETKPALADLTAMEHRVLKLVAQNKTSKQIASDLFVSPYTIETHRCNICTKLELHGCQSLLRFALEHKSHL